MSKVSNFILLALVMLFCTFCTNENKVKLIGEWQGVSWVIEGDDTQRNAAAVNFSFLENGDYKGNWGNDVETGVFSMDGDKLYTTEVGKLKKMVRVDFMGSDTVVFNMNRVGTEEQLFLVRK